MINEGNNVKPGPQTQCQVHYEGRLLENLTKDRAVPASKPFDSTYKNDAPSEFAPSGVMTCMREAMQLMGVGSKWELVCPPELAYGKRGMGSDIPGGAVLVYTMEILSCDTLLKSEM